MLRLVIFLVFLSFSSATAAENCGQNPFKGSPLRGTPLRGKTKSCAVSALEDNISKDVRSFHETSIQNAENVLNDKGFQDFISEINTKGPSPSLPLNASREESLFAQTFSDSSFQNHSKSDPPEGAHPEGEPPSSFYVFVSFSCSKKALLNLAEQAKRYGATLVLRGFKEGSYIKTAKALQTLILKTGQGVIIDPELFELFGISSVPTLILSKAVPLLSTDRVQTPIHDRIQGHVSLRYALEHFSKDGDLQTEAQTFLQRGAIR